MQFGKRSAPTSPEPVVPERPGAKNKPTPKRRDQEAARRRPLVQDGKVVTADQKQRRRAERARAREGMLKGDPKYLSARDRGPVKRFLRDAVDRRWNIGEILLPAVLIVLALTLVDVPLLKVIGFLAFYGLMLFGILDAYLLWRRTKTAVAQEFGQVPPKGSASYLLLRSFQMRMSRVPRPGIKRGEPLIRRG